MIQKILKNFGVGAEKLLFSALTTRINGWIKKGDEDDESISIVLLKLWSY